MLQAAIFDWDGTLADTRRAIVLSFQQVLSEINLEVPVVSIERRIGIGAADTFREILKAAKRPVDEQVVKQLVERKSQLQCQRAKEVALFEGSKELLESLHCKVKVGLASMNSRQVVMHLLTLNKLVDCFDVVLTVETVSHSKPDPEIFLKTAKRLDVKVEACVVFEDSIFGVKAAKAAGMRCIAVTTGAYKANELQAESPDLVIKNLSEPTILPFIFDS